MMKRYKAKRPRTAGCAHLAQNAPDEALPLKI
jgi:hypothetical protein